MGQILAENNTVGQSKAVILLKSGTFAREFTVKNAVHIFKQECMLSGRRKIVHV